MNHKPKTINLIFFGSTTDSVLVLEKLYSFSIRHSPALSFANVAFGISCIVTQPSSPIGRKQVITPTPVETWAKEKNIPVLSFQTNKEKPWLYQNEEEVINALLTFKPDLLISASYGQKIPTATIQSAKFRGLNIHPSLLPRWRGADPVPWAILTGDHQTGVTIVTLSEKFDEGNIIAQKKIPIIDTDTSDPLRTKLFSLGADLLIQKIPPYVTLSSRDRSDGEAISIKREIASSPSKDRDPRNDIPSKDPYARKFTRADGFIPWHIMRSAMRGETVNESEYPKLLQEAIQYSSFDIRHSAFSICNLAFVIERACRALSPWPGVWTEVIVRPAEKKRLKILSAHVVKVNDHVSPIPYHVLLDTVQLEGKTPVPFSQFQSAYL